MSRFQTVLSRLAEGPATNADLADVLCTHSGDVARLMAQLRYRGLTTRVDGQAGRGTRAIYALNT